MSRSASVTPAGTRTRARVRSTPSSQSTKTSRTRQRISRWEIARLALKPRIRELIKVGNIKVFIEDVKQTRDRWGKTYMQYVVTIGCGNLQWKVYKRYSEFVSLRSQCNRFLLKEKLPKLPSKKLSFFMNEEAVQSRRRGLEIFLHSSIRIPSVKSARNPTLLAFLGFFASREEAKVDIEDIEAWNSSYVSKIPPWLYVLKAMMPSQGNRVPIGLLRVNVISGKNLPRMDIIGSSDPYVVLKLGTRVVQEVRTKHILNTLNPCWEEQFVFEVINATSTLRVEVWDHDLVGEDDMIGFFDIALKYLTHEETMTGDFYLKPAEKEGDGDGDEKENSMDSKGKKKKLNNVWESKSPPRVKLQLRYSFSRLGEMASHWNPEPAPPVPDPKFEIDLLYKNLKILLINIGPIINFFYAIYMVLLWDDPYYSAWITFCFVVTCFHPWALAVFIQGWLIYYTLTKYVAYAWKHAHTNEIEAKLPESRISSAALSEPPPEEYKLGMIGNTLTLAIKSAGYTEDMTWYQTKLGTANWALESIYALFDWSSPSVTKSILVVLVGTFCYSLVFPVHYLTLTIGLYLLFMWTTPFMAIMWILGGFGRYMGREKVTSTKAKQMWKNVLVGARARAIRRLQSPRADSKKKD